MNLIKPDSNYDFVGKRKFAAIVSGLMVLASLLLFFVRGPSWGIDFTGGTEVHLKFDEPVDIGEVRAALRSLELGDDAVQRIGEPEDAEYTIRIQDPTFGTDDVQTAVASALRAKFGDDWIAESSFDAQVGARMTIRHTGPAVAMSDIEGVLTGIEGATVQEALDDNTFYVQLPGISLQIEDSLRSSLTDNSFQVLQVDSVGPKVGGELRRQGFLALGATLVLILIYVAFRFDLTFAPGAVLALFHDVSIVVGVFILLEMAGVYRQEFNLPIIGALLTIIGYSLNDTIVIYDRIRENMKKYRRKDKARLINDSINETLGRTFGTSMTTIMAMTAFLVLGGPVIQTFALAIIMGVFVGTYSTVYVASPTILLMDDLRPQLTRIFAPRIEAATATALAASEQAASPATETERRRIERQQARKGDGAGD